MPLFTIPERQRFQVIDQQEIDDGSDDWATHYATSAENAAKAFCYQWDSDTASGGRVHVVHVRDISGKVTILQCEPFMDYATSEMELQPKA